MPRAPRVRVIVVNYDGGDMTLRCLEALRDVDWPEDALEVVLVDNASIDGIAPRVLEELPWVRLVESVSNTGFAGGVNQGLGNLDEVEYVALLNNDAVPARDWLRPLVAALEADPGLGAANSKIVFAPSFVSLHVESPVFVPENDSRELGVCVTALEIDGRNVFDESQFAEGCHQPEPRSVDEYLVCWTSGRAEIRLPVPPGRAPSGFALVELAADRDKEIQVRCGETTLDLHVGRAPTWHKVPLGGPTFDVINNVGSRLVEGGYGGDRGFLERDEGQYEQPEEVFAWCGASVLLRSEYLRRVGRLDDRFFVYYEDTDLAWRGRLAGWRYSYVPASVVRHIHAATTKEGSTLFTHYVERNRFLTLLRNAPWSLFGDALYVYLRDTLVVFKRDVFGRMRQGRGPSIGATLRRLRAFFAFLKLAPATIVSRIRQRGGRARRAEVARAWVVPR